MPKPVMSDRVDTQAQDFQVKPERAALVSSLPPQQQNEDARSPRDTISDISDVNGDAPPTLTRLSVPPGQPKPPAAVQDSPTTPPAMFGRQKSEKPLASGTKGSTQRHSTTGEAETASIRTLNEDGRVSAEGVKQMEKLNGSQACVVM